MLFHINSPLDQFDILNLIPLKFGSIDISITNSFLFICLSFLLISLSYFFYIFDARIIPNYFQLIIENIVNFGKDMVVENIGKDFLSYFNFIFLIFFFLLISNLIGMVPYTFTVTSHIAITLTLAFIAFAGINIIGIYQKGFDMLAMFIPPGSPLVLAPFIILVEFISYIARLFSLAIRLFANIMSGHTLLKILSTFGWSIFLFGGIGFIVAFIPIGIVFVVTGLEIAIACLQAYVFTILVCIYLNEAVHGH